MLSVVSCHATEHETEKINHHSYCYEHNFVVLGVNILDFVAENFCASMEIHAVVKIPHIVDGLCVSRCDFRQHSHIHSVGETILSAEFDLSCCHNILFWFVEGAHGSQRIQFVTTSNSLM